MQQLRVGWSNPGLAATRAVLGLPSILGAVVCGNVMASCIGSPGWVLAGLLALGGLLLVYIAVGRLVNATTFTFGPESLVVAHGPLPWLPGPTLARGSILGFDLTYDADEDLAEAPEQLTALARQATRTRSQRLRGRQMGPSVEGHLLSAMWRSLAPSWSVEVVVVGGTMYPLVDGLATREEAESVLDALRAWHGTAAPPVDG